jgi:hypothetical protein
MIVLDTEAAGFDEALCFEQSPGVGHYYRLLPLGAQKVALYLL